MTSDNHPKKKISCQIEITKLVSRYTHTYQCRGQDGHYYRFPIHKGIASLLERHILYLLGKIRAFDSVIAVWRDHCNAIMFRNFFWMPWACESWSKRKKRDKMIIRNEKDCLQQPMITFRQIKMIKVI